MKQASRFDKAREFYQKAQPHLQELGRHLYANAPQLAGAGAGAAAGAGSVMWDRRKDTEPMRANIDKMQEKKDQGQLTFGESMELTGQKIRTDLIETAQQNPGMSMAAGALSGALTGSGLGLALHSTAKNVKGLIGSRR